MEKITFISGEEVTDAHIRQALSLDRVSYADCYQLNEQTCIDYHKKNSEIYIMAVDTENDMVIGYINFSPITEDMYRTIKSGTAIDTIINAENLITYKDNMRCSGYLSSIVVHPIHRQNGYASELLAKLEVFIFELAENHNIYFNHIIADAVSPVGIHILRKLGFCDVLKSNHRSSIMEMNLFSDDTPITKYNRRLKTIYKDVESNV